MDITDERGQAEYVLSFMHKSFLKTYIERQTRLDMLLKTGHYNCVSSAVLYTILGTALGLDVRGEATSDHAFCSVRLGDESVDVETTNPYGFDPGSRTEFHDEFGKITGFAYVSPKNYRARHSLSILELTALIFSNRIAELEQAGRYADAVPLSVDRYALLGNDGIDSELQGRLLNYAVYLAKSGRETDALVWGETAQNAYGTGKGWEDFLYRVRTNIKERELYSLLKAAEKIAREQGWLEGLRALDAAEAEFGPEKRLSEARLTFRQNRIAQLHNSFAQSFNQRRYEEARDRIRSALREFPEEKRLLGDLERVEKVIKEQTIKN